MYNIVSHRGDQQESSKAAYLYTPSNGIEGYHDVTQLNISYGSVDGSRRFGCEQLHQVADCYDYCTSPAASSCAGGLDIVRCELLHRRSVSVCRQRAYAPARVFVCAIVGRGTIAVRLC